MNSKYYTKIAFTDMRIDEEHDEQHVPVSNKLNIKTEFSGFIGDISRSVVPTLRNVGEKLKLFKGLSDTWKGVNFSNPLSVGIAACSSMSDVLCTLNPSMPTNEIDLEGYESWAMETFKATGYEQFSTSAAIDYLLMNSDKDKQTIKTGGTAKMAGYHVQYIRDIADSIKIVDFGTDDKSPEYRRVYVKDGHKLHEMGDAFDIWKDTNCYCLDGDGISSMKYDDVYVDGATYDRTKLLIDSGIVSSLLIVGPSGVGKTSMAHKLAFELYGPNYKMLYFGNNYLVTENGGIRKQSALRAVEIFNPDVVILDDIQQSLAYNNSVFLSMIAELRKAKPLLVATYMVDQKRESLYIPGMRPGRFDDIIELDYPDTDTRLRIAKIYARDSLSDVDLQLIADKTENFTGAYIKAITERLGVIGIQFIEQEIINLKKTLPR